MTAQTDINPIDIEPMLWFRPLDDGRHEPVLTFKDGTEFHRFEPIGQLDCISFTVALGKSGPDRLARLSSLASKTSASLLELEAATREMPGHLFDDVCKLLSAFADMPDDKREGILKVVKAQCLAVTTQTPLAR